MKLCTKQRKRKIMHPSVHLGYTSPLLPLHGFSPPPKKKEKKKKKKETRSLESFLESLMESIQQPLAIESLMLRLDVPHICVSENASYQRFFSILI